jgi:zinc transporter ZupT
VVYRAAGNFLYIAVADLVPEINKHESMKTGLLHFASFTAGLLLILTFRLALGIEPRTDRVTSRP